MLAYEIISTSESVEIPTRHHPDVAERVRLGHGVLLRSSFFEDRMLAAEANTEFEFTWPGPILPRVFPVAFPKGAPLPQVPPAFCRESPSTGLFVKLFEGAPERPPKGPADFRAFIEQFGRATIGESMPLVVLLQWSDRTTRGFFCTPAAITVLTDLPFEAGPGKRLSDGCRSILAFVKVGIVGMGSLGSEVAVSLARSGVRNFLLVDGDVLQGPNICRHAGSYGDVGALKVDVVKELIRDVSAIEPEVATRAVVLGSATNPELHDQVLADLGAMDFLIDATANSEVFCIIAMIASDNRLPLVWGEVFGGGIGGLVASAHPDQGPCPRCVRAGLLASASTWPPPPANTSKDPYGGGDGEPLEATHADVGVLASALSNRVIQLLTRSDETPPAVTLVGLRKAWIFESPMQSIAVKVRSDDWSCERCWAPAAFPDSETLSLVESLFPT